MTPKVHSIWIVFNEKYVGTSSIWKWATAKIYARMKESCHNYVAIWIGDNIISPIRASISELFAPNVASICIKLNDKDIASTTALKWTTTKIDSAIVFASYYYIAVYICSNTKSLIQIIIIPE